MDQIVPVTEQQRLVSWWWQKARTAAQTLEMLLRGIVAETRLLVGVYDL